MSVTTVVDQPRRMAHEATTAPLSVRAASSRIEHRRERLRWLVGATSIGAVVLVWTADNGGYDTTVWLPSTIVLLLVAVWLRVACGPAPRRGRVVSGALAALALYTLWSFASIAWAADPGTALLGSDRTLLYLVIFGLGLQLQWSFRRLQLTQLLYLAGLGVVGLLALIRLAVGSGISMLQNGQLAFPTGYHNSAAAVGTIGAGMGLLLVSGVHLRPVVRAACGAVTVICLELSLLSGSRGWLYTLPVIIVLIVALAPSRGRLLAWAGIPLLAAAATLPWVLHALAVASRTSGLAGERAVGGADTHAAQATLLAAGLCAGALFACCRLDARFDLGPLGRRLARRLVRLAGVALAGAVIAVVVVLAVDGSIARGWDQFTTDAPLKAGVSRFSQLGSGRYDYWRVAIDAFLSHPLGGLGQDNFAQAYTAARHTSEEPTWVHSLELRLLVHTGVVGVLLFAGWLVLAVKAVLRGRAAASTPGRLLLAAALVPLIVWGIHGSVDWFWEIPALSGPVFGFLAAAVVLGAPAARPGTAGAFVASTSTELVRVTRRRSARVRRSPRTRARIGRLLAGVLMVMALVAVVPAYFGELDIDHARTVSATQPGTALSSLANAAALEPFSDTPELMSAAVLLNAGRTGAALAQTRSGLGNDSSSWLLWLERGLAAGPAGGADLTRAHVLDPREPVITLAIRRATSRTPLTIAQAEAIFDARGAALIGR